MKYSIKGFVTMTSVLSVALSSGLTVLIWHLDISLAFKMAAILLVLMLLIVYTVSIFTMSRHINTIFKALSQTIQSMIDEVPNDVFSDIDDTILSKLQSQIIRLTNILKSHNSREKQQKEMITELISDISHQLKTPLSNLNIYTQLLLDENLSDKKRMEFTCNLNNQLKKLNWLMENLTKLSRLESGMINFNMKRQSIAQTVLQAVGMISCMAERKNIDILFEGDEKIMPVHDKKWTQEAIANILDNGVKYSENNRAISISIIQYKLFCRIDIADQGRGIPQTELNNIFKRFYRGKNCEDIEGVGIGLYLTRKIIAEQGGYIKVKSEVGHHTVFSVFLPL